MKKSTKWLLGILISIIVIGAGFFTWQKLKPQTASNPTTTEATTSESDQLNLKVGDKIAGMEIKSITPFSQQISPLPVNLPLSTTNASVEFSGQAQISGTYQYYGTSEDNSGILRDIVCFSDLDDSSISKMPKIPGDERDLWFCFSNNDLAKSLLGPAGATGKATILIDDYVINHYPSAVWNTAKLIKVSGKD